jgi:hypothetical protein
VYPFYLRGRISGGVPRVSGRISGGFQGVQYVIVRARHTPTHYALWAANLVAGLIATRGLAAHKASLVFQSLDPHWISHEVRPWVFLCSIFLYQFL